jgi:hypothetical protein
MVIEFHSNCCGINDFGKDQVSALEKITHTHHLVHLHGNNHNFVTAYNGVKVPNVFEATYVKKSLLPNIIPNEDPIPGELDFANGANTGQLRDICLIGPPYTTADAKFATEHQCSEG